jgi:hypothetical protein
MEYLISNSKSERNNTLLVKYWYSSLVIVTMYLLLTEYRSNDSFFDFAVFTLTLSI